MNSPSNILTGPDQQVGSLSLEFIEGLLADYLRNPDSVPPDWRAYFDDMTRAQNGGAPGNEHSADTEEGHHGNGNGATLAVKQIGPSFRPASLFAPPRGARTSAAALVPPPIEAPPSVPQAGPSPIPSTQFPPTPSPSRPAQSRDQWHIAVLQDRVDQLIRAYRVRGHLVAQIDPLGFPRPELPELDPMFYGFTSEDMDQEFSTATIEGPQSMTLGRIIQRLRNTYCRSIGVQFMHMDDLQVRQWLQDRMEGSENRCTLSRKEQLRILHGLTSATVFEEFIQRRFLGAKSFSLEGAETLIPLLDLTIERAGQHKVEEVVLAMAHRGRLNVLANVMGKSPQQIFREFADIDPELHIGRGDVKYHLGHSTDVKTAAGHRLHLSLCFNPSHLEFVNPVAMGRVRAKQDRVDDLERRHGMLLLIHGDAAFAGEGIIQETLNLSQLEAYQIGGTLHVVLNNQIGFTTSPAEGRSTTYATDVAKMLQIPIFHVNGEDPEAVAQVVRLAMDFRREFQRDVVIDMYCYRRRGHNEADEPQFTQPLLYQAIERRKNVREGYLDHLLKLGGIEREAADHIAAELRNQLDAELSAAKSEEFVQRPDLASFWAFYIGGREREAAEVETDMKREQLIDLLGMLSHVPRGFHPHPKIGRWLEQRREMIDGRRPIDWSAAEALAIGSLAVQKLRVRISGQDSERGTFSHRHAVLHDVTSGRRYMPLANLTFDQAPVEIYNSPLSEAGVLGFEYGYSLDCPDGLVMWEAQFGDFVNAAQVIIDQFIVSAEDKWRRLSGIVLLLPHGFEGMGPEHSSARLERFLQLAAKDNIQVANLTTPAQLFHCLRRQVLRVWRKPLVLMTPKSLLRHPLCVSSLNELAEGKFLRVLPDVPPAERTTVDRILLCSGKIYFELEQKRRQLNKHNVAILRIEQLYPLPKEPLKAALANYPDGTPVFWIQEEPENMGAWRYLKVHLGDRLFERFPFAGIYRQSAASPATGSHSSHKLEQEELLSRAVGE
ncbi:MAG TPA: 2-oxoglutarate dehydrogenase E1 component [Pirellulales bacterium]|nr:2-oxoglutarate dehydrogenase E1 component [Pirellulales bacterium]